MTFGWRIGKTARQRQRKALFESWVDEHATGLFGLAYRLCGDREMAEELVQETFFQAWKSMDRLRDADRAQAWLMTILRHCYNRAMRERVQEHGKPVLFLTLDLTDDKTRQQAELLASVLGMDEVWGELHQRTGFALLIKPGKGEVVGRFTAGQEVDEIHASITEHISG